MKHLTVACFLLFSSEGIAQTMLTLADRYTEIRDSKYGTDWDFVESAEYIDDKYLMVTAFNKPRPSDVIERITYTNFKLLAVPQCNIISAPHGSSTAGDEIVRTTLVATRFAYSAIPSKFGGVAYVQGELQSVALRGETLASQTGSWAGPRTPTMAAGHMITFHMDNENVPVGKTVSEPRFNTVTPGAYTNECTIRVRATYTSSSAPHPLVAGHEFEASIVVKNKIMVTRNLDLSVSTTQVNCGTVRVGDGEPVKCPVVRITDAGEVPDTSKYDLVTTISPNVYDLYADPGAGKIQKVVNEGEYVRTDGTLHLYLKGDGAPVGQMNQSLTITARVK